MKILGIPFVWILLLCSLVAPIGFLPVFATMSSSTVIMSSQDPSAFGHLVKFTAFVTPNNATGTVQFNDTSTSPPTTLGTGTLGITGNTTFSTSSLSVGLHNIVARYLGDSHNDPSVSGILVQNVNLASSSITLSSNATSITFGKSVNFTALVSPPFATGTVQFNDSSTIPSTVLGTGAISGGKATFVISSLSVGSHDIIATYLGDTNDFSSASNMLILTVNPVHVSSTTVLSSNATSILFGHLVKFTAFVTPNNATGTVQFNDTSTSPPTTLGTGTLGITGNTTFSTSSLSVGLHNIVARYLGDSHNAPSVSGILLLTVNPLHASSTTTLSSNATSITFGKSVNFTAIVSPSSATGTIQFLVNGTNSGSPVTLSGGKATLATSSLPAGTNNVVASYSGNSNLNPSVSNSVKVTVKVTTPVQGVTLGKVTGGGHLEKGVNFAFHVIADSNGKKIKGNLVYIDKNSKIKLRSNNMTALFIDQTMTHASFGGRAIVNGTSGFTFSVILTDPDKKGEHDGFSITITDSSGKMIYQNSHQVKGHIEIHKAHKNTTPAVKPINEKDSDNENKTHSDNDNNTNASNENKTSSDSEKKSDNENESDNENAKGNETHDPSVKHNLKTNNSHGNNKHKVGKQKDD